MIEITVPEVGESVSSGILALWLKKDGEYVQEGDELFELETDKATMAVPSQHAGVLHIQAEEGQEVDVGAVVAQIDTQASASDSAAAEQAQGDSNAPSSSGSGASPAPALDDLSPAVRKLVAEHRLDPGAIPASGPGGRLLKEDVLSYLDSAGAPASSGSQPGAGAAGRGPQAEPAGSSGARGTAGSGAAAGQAPGSASAAPAARGQAGNAGAWESPWNQTSAQEADRQERRVPMTTIRKRIAQRLVESKQSAAHLTTFNEVDMSAVMEIRSRYKADFEKRYGVRLGFMSFFIKAAVSALQAFPGVNAFIDGEDIIYHDYADIGVAMSTERGLITPVLRSCETLSFAQIEAQILDYGQKAQAKRLLPDDLLGGTFTVSNGGVFGSMLSTPIPNPPQTAVLGMHTIQERPVVRDGQIVARPMMYLALTYDHRMIDGKEAISFLMHLKQQLEDPSRMILGL
ncbi:2-oxoglutarate dehydrogenase complex dihydrolipoyllysine-residue succinyltransferase [Spirochaeta lutea]|uniref:Dihydrolipoyllysine-residue succinyltransferase component of 2-oxoglutarate dehydrogenase complex n=1 Tax=Spirochaeta lutea TaxID=1480694 RepID=A0A098QU45_9SPIO|nr:2-oxoglutarate dehydrogenase complex dihydrolipoyllysine-residue succinyltransferase [Spirochaeta lutea]KGE70903.1 hypothetical protein DC28_13225 [Spirochaeta lutea]